MSGTARFVLAALVVATSVAASPASAQRGSDAERRAALQAYRDSLETEVVQKFVNSLARDLRLDSSQKSTVEAVLRTGSERRRALAKESSELQYRLYRAVRDDDTTDSEFQRLLASHESLRRQEHDLWMGDQRALARVLSPRQRSHFLLSWTRFQETLREIMSRRPGGRDNDNERNDRAEHDH